MNKKLANAILDKLEETYPDAKSALNFASVFQLLIAVVLSAQTTDKSVNQVTPLLFARYPDAEALAAADPQDVEKITHRIGMYRIKTKNIIALSARLLDETGGEVPGDYDKLISLPGVGRKSANVVLSVGFGEARIAVDTHVFRVSNRLGLVREKDVLSTEKALMRILPKERWSRAHHLLIFHGRNCCHAQRPRCAECPVASLCEKHI